MNLNQSDLDIFQKKVERMNAMYPPGVAAPSTVIGGLGGLLPEHFINHPYPATINAMIYHASVERAENGYILKVIHKQGEPAQQYVAATTEELQRVFIAAIVTERITK